MKRNVYDELKQQKKQIDDLWEKTKNDVEYIYHVMTLSIDIDKRLLCLEHRLKEQEIVKLYPDRFVDDQMDVAVERNRLQMIEMLESVSGKKLEVILEEGRQLRRIKHS